MAIITFPLPRPRLPQMPLSVVLVAILFVVIVVLAVLAPWIAPQDPNDQSLLARLRPPGYTYRDVTYLLGTDDLGRDLLSRVLYGARISLAVSVLSVAVSTVVGVSLGMVAGWYRGWVETLIMRAVDIMMSIPAILLAVLTVAVLGPGFIKLVLVLGLTRWPRYTRVAFGQTLTVAGLPFIRASELAGAGAGRILIHHILPNIAGPILIVATAEFGLMILFESGLSFLGLGIQPPTPSWGSIMSVGRQYLERAPWIVFVPGACLFLLVFSVNVLGDWLRDWIDPRSRSR
ncbi:MAG: ABC transporter permease [Paracoccus sp. (in: a-proteobacteria)]|jgi:peptide/nickel transport system permease protein|uniref:ABC transporter permease n=1 Tax=unclassified Paracoccus (in: a-proteobacteria) TaxID=2688777 RepID=UPI000C6823B0|nr:MULTISPECIES: ABC transporter permease [unclassified Paracoccus (in: a-proteobacteria)]MBA47522.1 peptide ABC transporter permease [Paracoccus sp. (in: a-proteobacteria)]MCS5600673.1 ABC transporter permease [Paracoccus sp. (in: a-proteobacteria)]MDB2551347.1 ABC transporter permease [Paracoccus sp. (in: a-proteobacteria)]|tara:strand:- start:170 stop:1036 length:867 start_codon:yes stop_codon:yes gene_type:complete